MTDDTVESNLGDSLWVLLKEETQKFLVKQISSMSTLEGRFKVIEKTLLEYTNKSLWSRAAFPNNASDYDDSKVKELDSRAWYWTTFPHPSGWPKRHASPKAFIIPKYDDKERTYLPGLVFLPRGGCYKEVDVALLLAYSNLMLPPLSPIVTAEQKSVGDQFIRMLRIIARGDGSAFGKGLTNEAAQRYATKLLYEAKRAVK